MCRARTDLSGCSTGNLLEPCQHPLQPPPPPTNLTTHHYNPLPLFCTCASFQSSFSHSQLQPFLSIHLFPYFPSHLRHQARHNLFRSQTLPASPAPNNLWCSHANSSHLYKLMGLSIVPCRRTFPCTTQIQRSDKMKSAGLCIIAQHGPGHL